jgi:hypothetical protein
LTKRDKDVGYSLVSTHFVHETEPDADVVSQDVALGLVLINVCNLCRHRMATHSKAILHVEEGIGSFRCKVKQ